MFKILKNYNILILVLFLNNSWSKSTKILEFKIRREIINMKFYDFSARKINGQEVNMKDYKGKVILVVNTASKCGLTPQFKELEESYKQYKEQGFEILGFPCNQFANQDSGSNETIHQFCQLNYGVTFTMFEKIVVNGQNAHPLYKYLKNEAKGLLSKEIKWNFTKFLIDSQGNVIKKYAPNVSLSKINVDIEKLLKNKRINVGIEI